MLYLVRGLPGSGKTTLVSEIRGPEIIAADDYFMVDGEYHFDPSKLPAAHQWCQEQCKTSLKMGLPVAVTNTFSQRWELEPYLQMATELSVRMFVLDLFDSGMSDAELHQRNVHGVPLEGIEAMRSRWEHDWGNGDPRPPWERGA